VSSDDALGEDANESDMALIACWAENCKAALRGKGTRKNNKKRNKTSHVLVLNERLWITPWSVR
jgi:hypothetical protein